MKNDKDYNPNNSEQDSLPDLESGDVSSVPSNSSQNVAKFQAKAKQLKNKQATAESTENSEPDETLTPDSIDADEIVTVDTENATTEPSDDNSEITDSETEEPEPKADEEPTVTAESEESQPLIIPKINNSNPKLSRSERTKRRKHKRVFAGVIILTLAMLSVGTWFGYSAYINSTTTIVPEALAYVEEDNSADLCKTFTDTTLKCTVTWDTNENVRRGALISQSLSKGDRVDKESAITLSYSSGPATSKFPDLVGKPLEEAKAELYAIGVEIKEIKVVDSNGRPENTVVSASVENKTTVKNGSTTILEVSNGKITVPDWTGKAQEYVEADAKKLGITVSFKIEENDGVSGVVLSQTPKAGEVDTATEIVVVISKAFESKQIVVPDIIGKDAETAQIDLATAGFRHIKTIVVKNYEVTSKQVTQVVPSVGQTGGSEDNIVLIVSEPAPKE